MTMTELTTSDGYRLVHHYEQAMQRLHVVMYRVPHGAAVSDWIDELEDANEACADAKQGLLDFIDKVMADVE
jgi:hypothetical protein